MVIRPDSLASVIDHTLLRPDAAEADVARLCREAVEHSFHAVCVNPFWVPRAARLLRGTPVSVASVVDFPLGASPGPAKAAQARAALEAGAVELDMVMNVGALKSGEDGVAGREIEEVVRAAPGATVKVILETCLLTPDEKVRACRLAQAAGAHFVKTSTGFAKAGATVEDVELLRRTVGPAMGVKAAGGIRDAETAARMLQAGASRLGTSSGVRIVTSKGAADASS